MDLWKEFLLSEEKRLGSRTTNEWLRSLKILKFDACNLYLQAKDPFHILWFNEHVGPKLNRSFYNHNGHLVKVHLVASKGLDLPKRRRMKDKPLPPIAESYSPDPIESYASFPQFISENKRNIPYQLLADLVGYKKEKHTFGKPKIQLGEYNPIYLYGPPGCGKTHLLMATAQACIQKGIPTFYVRAETFSEHVIRAFRSTTLQIFRQSYRQNSVLIIDDVHILSRKTATQEELFHTFNTLHTAEMQLIFSANCSPRGLKEIEERLISRFEWGLALPFEPLSQSELKSITTMRCKLLKFPLNESLIAYLLTTFKSLKTLLVSIEALALRTHRSNITKRSIHLTIEIAKSQLQDLIDQESRNQLNPEKILKVVANSFGIRIEDIVGKSQSRDCTIPRQIAMYLCRTKLNMPYLKIGGIFARDHSTVMTSVKLVTKGIESKDDKITSPLLDIHKKVSSF